MFCRAEKGISNIVAKQDSLNKPGEDMLLFNLASLYVLM